MTDKAPAKKPRRNYPKALKQEVCDAVQLLGLAGATDKFKDHFGPGDGIHKNTIKYWADQAGISCTVINEKNAIAVETKQLKARLNAVEAKLRDQYEADRLVLKRTQLIDKLLSDGPHTILMSGKMGEYEATVKRLPSREIIAIATAIQKIQQLIDRLDPQVDESNMVKVKSVVDGLEVVINAVREEKARQEAALNPPEEPTEPQTEDVTPE